jgi:FkbM family methyltransferase
VRNSAYDLRRRVIACPVAPLLPHEVEGLCYAAQVNDLMVKALLAVHKRVDHHPQLHRRLAALATNSVGERRVQPVIIEITRPGDCVWDVGAQVGTYTRQFLELVGHAGHVVAFEPIPENATLLRSLAPESQLTVVEAALADHNGMTSFVISGKKSGGKSHIGESPDGLKVRVTRGDTILEEGIPKPDVIKIDVEGFEGDVLNGLPNVLEDTRCLVIEVHFAAMSRRGIPNEPMRILGLLRNQGFTARWIDTSHLLATR